MVYIDLISAALMGACLSVVVSPCLPLRDPFPK